MFTEHASCISKQARSAVQHTNVHKQIKGAFSSTLHQHHVSCELVSEFTDQACVLSQA